LYPEVPYVLSTLKARGHAVGIISNISCMLPAYLEQLGISGHLDFAIASASFGASKPHPSIFEEALRLAMVPAEKAMHVGDSYEADIVGARAVGITPVLIDRDDTSPHADCRRINNLCSLLEL
jgi:putative hydrolase of the HAD superfamily